MANDVKPGMSADDAAIEKIQFTPDWVGKISYWIFHYRKPLLILFVLITILLGRWPVSCGCRRRSPR